MKLWIARIWLGLILTVALLVVLAAVYCGLEETFARQFGWPRTLLGALAVVSVASMTLWSSCYLGNRSRT